MPLTIRNYVLSYKKKNYFSKIGLCCQEINLRTELPGSNFLLPTFLTGGKWDFEVANVLLAIVNFKPCYLSVSLSVCMSLSLLMSVCLSLPLFLTLSACLSISDRLHIYFWAGGYKKISFSTELSMIFFLLINVLNANNGWHFNIYEQEK